MASALSGIGSPHHHEDDVGVRAAEALGRREELREALLPHQAPDGSDHHSLDIHPEGRPGPSAAVLVRGGAEALQVDAVAEQHQLVAGNAQTGQHLEVLGVLDQLGSRAQRRRPFEGVDHGPARGPILRAGVEAVHRVDHAGHPGGTGRQPTVQARLGVVGVDDVGFEPPEEPPQFGQGHHVLADGHGPGGVTQGLVSDAPGLQPGYVRSGSRHSHHLHSSFGKGSELGAEQQRQAHVHRGDVEQPLPDERGHRALLTCS